MKRNIEHSTFNIQRRRLARRVLIGRWKLNVQCSMFPSAILFFFATLPLQVQTNALPALLPPYGELAPTFWEQHATSVIIGCAALLVLAALALWKMLQPKPTIVLPPEIVAREALAKLQPRPEDGKVLSEVSQILRRYVVAALGLPAAEMTTTEFCAALAVNEKIGAENAGSISDFLHECDAKKFSASPAVIPLNAAGRALELIAGIEACRSRSAPVPGAATSGGPDITANRQTQSSSDVAASGDGRTP